MIQNNNRPRGFWGFLRYRAFIVGAGTAALLIVTAFHFGLLVTPKEHLEIVDKVRRALRDSYLDPKMAQQMDRMLEQQIGKGEHRGFSNAISLMIGLTGALQEVSQDRHLRVGYSFNKIPVEDNRPLSAKELAAAARAESSDNFGLLRVERLEGHIGYIALTRFSHPDWSEPALAAAMDRVSDTKALIIDLRDNHGGSPAGGLLLASYFFAQPVHWVDFQSARGVEERWTLPAVRGKRYLDKPVVLLTSRHTFSAGEGFSYHMKNLGRATVVGEPTGGGANPGVRRRLHGHYWIFVPNARAVSPITHTNWEHVGVTPDIQVPAEEALNVGLAKLRDH